MDINKLVVKAEEFKSDYVFIVGEKEVALATALLKLDERVAQEIEAIRPTLIEKVSLAIKEEVNKEYDDKIEMYEKYLEEMPEVVEETIAEEIPNEADFAPQL